MPDQGTPDFGDVRTLVGNPLRYPRRIAVQVLESAFSEEHLYTGEVNPFLYKKDPDGEVAEDSKIVIADGYTDELKQTEPRPMLIVSRGDFGFLNLAIGEKIDTFTSGGRRGKYADMTEVPINVNCVGRRDLEAEELAWVVTGMFRLFRPYIRKKANIFKWSDPRVGAPIVVQADSQADLFLVPVSMTVHQSIRWDVKQPPRLVNLEYQFVLPNEEVILEVTAEGE